MRISRHLGRNLFWQFLVLVLLFAAVSAAQSKKEPADENAVWHFAVSGDSRNCGDVVMPAIAAGVIHDHAAFYWHLGDLRATFMVDDDIQQAAKLKNKPLNISDYQSQEWDDFIENEITPFGEMPFYLGIGNHETIPPKGREPFIIQFADWLDAPILREQRLLDNRKWRTQGRLGENEKNRNARQLKTYYHWKQGMVDFIYLDNATPDQFDAEQLKWFDRVIKDDAEDSSIRTVVLGVHASLPWSISCDHSMNESGEGERSGQKVYLKLLNLQNKAHKHVYVLASHSHFFMDGVYNTKYWHEHGGVLPGWIVGTGGAVRYRLPVNKSDAKSALEDTYGYLLGTVYPDGTIQFEFKEVKESDVPAGIKERYTPEFVHAGCFEGNRRTDRPPEPDFCAAVAEPVGQAAPQ